MKNHTYYACQRKGKTLVAVAAIEYPHGATTCTARAERDLRATGFPMYALRVLAEQVTTQKNFRQRLGMLTFRAAA